MRVRPCLDAGFRASIASQLRPSDELLETSFPGDDGRRQPVHTVYVSADRYTVDLPRTWGQAALHVVEAQGGMHSLCRRVGLNDSLSDEVAPRVATKLAEDPIEDLRLDFEDGFGNRGDDVEDAAAVSAATELATAIQSGLAPSFAGLRFKCFEEATRERGIRTLDLFLGSLIEAHGSVPDALVMTFPKVSTVGQVEAMVRVCEELESLHGLEAGRLGFEIQVETPQIILGPDGQIPIAAAIHAGDGRVTSLHYGTYDYSASLQISAEYQASDHPAADLAKQIMQLAVAGTRVQLSDGSTNILPIGDPAAIERGWLIHAGLVRRALERGFYQGWDLHPHQLPTRYIATFAFYREGLPRSARRLRDYLTKTGSGILDEPATARALARYLQRGWSCGAVSEEELLELTGLTGEQVATLAKPRSDTEITVDS